MKINIATSASKSARSPILLYKFVSLFLLSSRRYFEGHPAFDKPTWPETIQEASVEVVFFARTMPSVGLGVR